MNCCFIFYVRLCALVLRVSDYCYLLPSFLIFLTFSTQSSDGLGIAIEEKAKAIYIKAITPGGAAAKVLMFVVCRCVWSLLENVYDVDLC